MGSTPSAKKTGRVGTGWNRGYSGDAGTGWFGMAFEQAAFRGRSPCVWQVQQPDIASIAKQPARAVAIQCSASAFRRRSKAIRSPNVDIIPCC